MVLNSYDRAIEDETDCGKVLKYGGDFGERATDYCFCTDGIIFADRTPSPKAQEVKYLYQSIKAELHKNRITIDNRNLFTNTTEYDFVLSILCGQKSIYEKTYQFDVMLLGKKDFDLGVPELSCQNECCIYNMSIRLKKDEKWAEKGFEIGFAQTVFEAKDTVETDEVQRTAEKKEGAVLENSEQENHLKIIHGDVNIGVRAEQFFVMFSKQEAGPISLVYSGKEYITRTPKPIFTRAYTDNDRGCGLDFYYAAWNKAGKTAKCTDFRLEEFESSVKVGYSYILPIEGITCDISYTVYPNGNIFVDYVLKGEKPFTIPLYGMEFKLPKEFCNVRYVGNGPEENYCDRNCGAKLGLYETTAKDNLSPYLIPQECGNRTGVRYMEVMDSKEDGIC